MADKKTTSIAIFTITEGMNYGQRLQNYALQEVLMSFSDAAHEVAAETVVNTLWSRFAPLSYWQELDACFENPGFQKKKAQMPPMEFSRWLGKEVLRQQAFRQFDQENGHRSSIQISHSHLQAAANDIRETYDWASSAVTSSGIFILAASVALTSASACRRSGALRMRLPLACHSSPRTSMLGIGRCSADFQRFLSARRLEQPS